MMKIRITILNNHKTFNVISILREINTVWLSLSGVAVKGKGNQMIFAIPPKSAEIPSDLTMFL